MYPQTNYEMSEDDLKEILNACKPTPVMKIGDYVVPSPQENANRAWERLGTKMGFDHTTVKPIPGKGNRFFSAVPSETEEARKEREKREAKEAREREIAKLEEEIAVKVKKLEMLRKGVEVGQTDR